MELISIKDFSDDVKIEILQELGYKSDGKYVLNPDGTKVKDKYINTEILLSKMVILPGSTIILDDNPLSIASYFNEYDKEDV